MQRTSFVSAAGGNWKCMPRRVPRLHVEGDVGLGDDGVEAVILELVLAERTREEAAVVLNSLEVDDKGPKQCRFRKQHRSP